MKAKLLSCSAYSPYWIFMGTASALITYFLTEIRMDVSELMSLFVNSNVKLLNYLLPNVQTP